MIKHAHAMGRQAALKKYALAPPTQVDQFVADVESGKDVPPESMMAGMGGPPPPALDGTTPMDPSQQFDLGTGSTVAPEMAGMPEAPPPSNGMLGG